MHHRIVGPFNYLAWCRQRIFDFKCKPRMTALMTTGSHNSLFFSGHPNGIPTKKIIYAWARDAPALILPEGVGFKIGKKSRFKYLVLQVHYSHVQRFEDGSTDDSGIVLHYTTQPLKKLAGVYVLGTGGGIPPHSIQYMETSCRITENKTLYPFAYRTHTHALGKIVAGYVIKDNKWIKLGKRDPLTPQMFYKTFNNVTINNGDVLAARCTMQSERDSWTLIGNTNKDEMCNFYLMYYVENDDPLSESFCFSMGPPTYTWQKDHLNNIPDVEASTL
ncbi:peptidylglycine alpha-hydroxylating monooxygenase [Copidosoma floridanum]|uniref:peptidylglycine alpha-hydroxylating monooxygenase n=1 Tax=Copidosoma floridanum TaxID=29053 RepID=UPI000C6F5ABF|nr:peptidylglycine alpha-hydroxylating monooxygenase [Copidosoma floridanum]